MFPAFTNEKTLGYEVKCNNFLKPEQELLQFNFHTSHGLMPLLNFCELHQPRWKWFQFEVFQQFVRKPCYLDAAFKTLSWNRMSVCECTIYGCSEITMCFNCAKTENQNTVSHLYLRDRLQTVPRGVNSHKYIYTYYCTPWHTGIFKRDSGIYKDQNDDGRRQGKNCLQLLLVHKQTSWSMIKSRLREVLRDSIVIIP